MGGCDWTFCLISIVCGFVVLGAPQTVGIASRFYGLAVSSRSQLAKII